MNLIFDYDGTLNNCMKTYRPAFHKAYAWLVEKGYVEPKNYSDKEISYWLGFTGVEMWEKFQPQLPFEIREICRNMISVESNAQITNGNAELFDGAERVLAQLHADGHTLIFLSNCRKLYMQNHNEIFGLDRYFDFFYCSEEFDNIPKFEIFRKFKDRHKGEYIVIGDRFHDIETAVKNDLKSIGCAYGYGSEHELSDADIIVNNVMEIPDAVKTLTVI